MLFKRKKNALAPTDAASRAQSGDLQLVDVREAAEVAQDGVPYARNIPLRDLESRIGEIDHDRQVAFLCRSGMRSGSAAKIARRHGFDALNVEGGMIAWRRQVNAGSLPH